FEELKKCEDTTVIFFENPKRLLKTLNLLREVFGEETPVCVARELTKLHEEYIRGTLREVIEELEKRGSIKGEIVVVFRV
ncbi:MAG: rRNA (cytidine-2'-O-)-methyltransferase, partial [Aquificae bacterium]|nr:rRNA (cytidine-2'-O-)-methyltransferase [Aquificota bacterium]